MTNTELPRQVGLVLDLAESELETRHACISSDEEKQAHKDALDDYRAARAVIAAAPGLYVELKRIHGLVGHVQAPWNLILRPETQTALAMADGTLSCAKCGKTIDDPENLQGLNPEHVLCRECGD